MKQVTRLVLFIGAASLAACATQAPAPATTAVAPQVGVAATAAPPATATPATAASTPALAPSATAAPTPALAPSATAAPATANVSIPSGYKRVVMNGKEKYCKTEGITGSRTETHRICMTLAELQAQEDGTRDFILQTQHNSGVGIRANTPGP